MGKKTTIEVDPTKIAQAQAILGTTTMRDTVDTALAQVITDAARRRFVELAAEGTFAELVTAEAERRIWG